MTTTEEQEDRADALFHALADRTRRDILRRVLAGEHSVSTLARGYDMSFAAVQKHVAVLERAGLVSKRRSGREALASGEVEALRSVASMLTELESVWRGRIARIDDLLAGLADATNDAHHTIDTTDTHHPTQEKE
ncbi:metalloregulator ArsR/SmtB family transcription factor [Knoellia locipacati]|uniref:Putative transcriptional regulator, ArsR family protein n=1 Tax=Knoellia locipacati TaxID=882824 RepID=A0A512SXG5_9MICO|nr:metalloregulator ArsR/SmtB family transcription factor [Knoellia locipacati]GEQ12660.1 putative transcriptional regulator, ArsR family protein [Knoellia locipacati]